MQSGLLHPFVALFLIFSFVKALQLNVVLAHVAASAGTYGLARRRGADAWGAATAGLVFALCGALTSQSNVAYLVGNAMVPWALWGAEVAISQRTPRAQS